MPPLATDAMARAVPTDVIKGIVGDHCRRSAPTPPSPKNIVDSLPEKFGPKADSPVGESHHRRVVARTRLLRIAIDDARAALPTAGSLVRLGWRSVARRVSGTTVVPHHRITEEVCGPRALGQSGRHRCKRRNGN